MAMAILSSITPLEFIKSINQQNTDLLVKLPGIGKKTAERLVVEMKDSIQQLPTNGSLPAKQTLLMSQSDEAISALEALGYKHQEAVKVITKIDDGQKNCEQLIRQALQVLAGR